MAFINLDEVSIVHWYDETVRHRCGYCKSEEGSVSNGMCNYFKVMLCTTHLLLS